MVHLIRLIGNQLNSNVYPIAHPTHSRNTLCTDVQRKHLRGHDHQHGDRGVHGTGAQQPQEVRYRLQPQLRRPRTRAWSPALTGVGCSFGSNDPTRLIRWLVCVCLFRPPFLMAHPRSSRSTPQTISDPWTVREVASGTLLRVDRAPHIMIEMHGAGRAWDYTQGVNV